MQPPSGGCVLKQEEYPDGVFDEEQPPSGGCVLKRMYKSASEHTKRSHLRVAVC